jgi:hypothetical protein
VGIRGSEEEEDEEEEEEEEEEGDPAANAGKQSKPARGGQKQ